MKETNVIKQICIKNKRELKNKNSKPLKNIKTKLK